MDMDKMVGGQFKGLAQMKSMVEAGSGRSKG
jgi:hypothetical protein